MARRLLWNFSNLSWLLYCPTSYILPLVIMSYQNLERVKDFEFFNRNNFHLSIIRNQYRYTNKNMHKCRVGCCGIFPILVLRAPLY